MAKETVVRSNKLFTMYKRVARRRGRGAKFQWNAEAQYVITYAGGYYADKPSRVFKSFKEADKEWVYLTLKY